jgi:RNA polymerase sigma-70 factor (ECF subfamily)
VQKSRLDHITDQELLDQFYADYDNNWLGILLQRYVLLLFGVCMKYLKNEEEAKDSVQQIFLKAITELHKYRVNYFSSWIYKVARNHCLMKLRDRQGRVSLAVMDDLPLVIPDAQAEDNLLQKEQVLQLMALSMEELNEEQKRCVTLFYLEKKSYQEIAACTGYSTMQVKSYIQNGKRNLKISLDKKLNKVS